MPARRLPALLGLLLLASVGCRTDPAASARQHLERGDRYMHDKGYAEAAIEYRVAASLLPTDPDAHAKLAKAYMKQENIRGAFEELL